MATMTVFSGFQAVTMITLENRFRNMDRQGLASQCFTPGVGSFPLSVLLKFWEISSVIAGECGPQ